MTDGFLSFRGSEPQPVRSTMARFGMIRPTVRRGNRIMLKRMVRAVGIEPTLLAERDFESRASTNFTTPALRGAYSAAVKTRNTKHGILAYVVRFAVFFRTSTFWGLALRTLTADASMLFFRWRP